MSKSNAQEIIFLKEKPFFEEPCMNFNKPVSFIKACEKRELISRNKNELFFKNENTNTRGVIYYFKDKKLSNIIVLLSENIIKETKKYLNNNFRYIGDNYKDESIYVSLDYSVFTMITWNKEMEVILIFFPVVSDPDIKELVENYRKNNKNN